jgi:hypothetical protein
MNFYERDGRDAVEEEEVSIQPIGLVALPYAGRHHLKL